MRKSGFLADLAGLFGIGLALIPWLYFETPGWGSYAMTCIGAIFAGISRADSLSDILERGNPGDEFLRESGSRLKNWISKLK